LYVFANKLKLFIALLKLNRWKWTPVLDTIIYLGNLLISFKTTSPPNR